jgi:hypothetical protein
LFLEQATLETRQKLGFEWPRCFEIQLD